MPRLVLDLQSTSVNWKLPREGAERVRRGAPAGWEVVVVQAPTISDGDGNPEPSAESREAIRDADVYFGFGLARPLFDAARRLRWVHSAAAGVRGLLYPEMVASDVLLTNSAGIHAVPMAEHVVGGVIYLLRGFDRAVDLHRAGRWDKAPWTGAGADVREVGEQRVLVVGAGGIGGAIGGRLAALGATVTGIRRNPDRGVPPGFAAVHPPEALEALLPAADVLVLAAPFTPETGALIGAERLARLPEGAIVVNMARGALLDTGALVTCLTANRLRGAVLDVFEQEPLPADSPLWGLRQVLLTPHISAVSPRRFWERQLSLFEENWRRWVAGEPLRNVVDKRAGY